MERERCTGVATKVAFLHQKDIAHQDGADDRYLNAGTESTVSFHLKNAPYCSLTMLVRGPCVIYLRDSWLLFDDCYNFLLPNPNVLPDEVDDHAALPIQIHGRTVRKFVAVGFNNDIRILLRMTTPDGIVHP
ncbi:unnamed protein product, partial [Amoebophrya sp. A120]|eukprot:GSA120T00010027001.1